MCTPVSESFSCKQNETLVNVGLLESLKTNTVSLLWFLSRMLFEKKKAIKVVSLKGDDSKRVYAIMVESTTVTLRLREEKEKRDACLTMCELNLGWSFVAHEN